MPRRDEGTTSVTTPLRDGITQALRQVMGRLMTTVGAATAAALLVAAAPGASGSAGDDSATPAPDSASRFRAELRLVSADRQRWPGHPGRALVRHRVRPGETATGLAVRFHAWTRELRAVNHLGRHARLLVGERIKIPVVLAAVRKARAHRSRHHSAHRPAHRPVHRVTHRAPRPSDRHTAHRHPKPKPWRHADASRASVRRYVVRSARRHGVEPNLALAISWQESGWQQRRISSAGAIGAMQVMPATGRWMSLTVGRRLNLYGLGDNVTAGVRLIDVLRGETSERRTVAAYYQGLGAVQRHGLYPSTKLYVRDVLALRHRLRHGWDPS
jgi:Transglycosylase SLT domain/LysM domain